MSATIGIQQGSSGGDLFSRRPPSQVLEPDSCTILKFLSQPLTTLVGRFATREHGGHVLEAVRMECTFCAVRLPGVPHLSSWYLKPLKARYQLILISNSQ